MYGYKNDPVLSYVADRIGTPRVAALCHKNCSYSSVISIICTLGRDKFSNDLTCYVKLLFKVILLFYFSTAYNIFVA